MGALYDTFQSLLLKEFFCNFTDTNWRFTNNQRFQSLLLKEFFCNVTIRNMHLISNYQFQSLLLKEFFCNTCFHGFHTFYMDPNFNPYYLRNSFATLFFHPARLVYNVKFQSLLLKEFFCNFGGSCTYNLYVLEFQSLLLKEFFCNFVGNFPPRNSK